MNITWEMMESALGMFIFLALELTVLFLLISYLVGLAQEWMTPEKVQRVLASRHGRGYLLAALMGALTPFCSCSTIPFLKGLLRARAGFGVMMVFLLASPLLNPVIIGLFVVTFGWKVSALYFVVAMSVSVLGGYLLERLGFEKHVKASAWMDGGGGTCCVFGESVSRWRKAWVSTWSDFKSVLPYLMVGVSLGALIYGFLPSEWIASVAGDHNPWAVPVAAVIGIPLYIRAEAVIPLSVALVAKGMSLGPVMALIIGSAGASLTEVILLKALFKTPLIVAFLVVILSMAMGAGYLYMLLF